MIQFLIIHFLNPADALRQNLILWPCDILGFQHPFQSVLFGKINKRKKDKN